MTDKETEPFEETAEKVPVETAEVVIDETPELKESPLDKAQKEATEMKSRWLRSVADMENYRKRIAREKQEIIRSAGAQVVESLLPMLDNLKLGLQAAENHPEAKDVTIGFQMVEMLGNGLTPGKQAGAL